MTRHKLLFVILPALVSLPGHGAFAEPRPSPAPAIESVLTPLQQRRSEEATDRALVWLALQHKPDGSFPTVRPGQPGVTGLCLLAFLSRGHLPGQGQYGDNITRAIEYILTCQADDGMLSLGPLERPFIPEGYSHSGSYNHPIAALALCEAYGMADRELSRKMKPAIEAARDFTLKQQRKPKTVATDRGGWRYLVPSLPPTNGRDSDLSISSWHLLFLRSAKNAGFDVPTKSIDDALDYVERSFDEKRGVFVYVIDSRVPLSRGMVGAGILSMSLAGRHDSMAARAGGQWVLGHGFDPYRGSMNTYDRYFYGLFYCTQGMFQLGGRYWKEFFPGVVDVLLANQSPEGAWDPDTSDAIFGKAYTTALCVLTLNTPRQLLPIFQR
jgi:hypothetical protein